MTYFGDIVEDATIDFSFTTRDKSGAPATLGGTPSLAVYKGNSTTQSSTGVTLTGNFDGVTGLNHVRVDTSDAFYATGNDYLVVLAAGTVDGIDVTGEVVGHFSIENRPVNVDRLNGADRDAQALAAFVGGMRVFDVTSATVSTVVIESGVDGTVSSADDHYMNCVCFVYDGFGAGGNARLITDYDGSMTELTVAPDWDVVPTTGSKVVILPVGSVDLQTIGRSAAALAAMKALYASGLTNSSVNDGAATDTSFVTNLTEATDDHYNDHVLLFTSGALIGQARRISDYDGTSKALTFYAAFTEAPADTDEFLILGRIE